MSRLIGGENLDEMKLVARNGYALRALNSRESLPKRHESKL